MTINGLESEEGVYLKNQEIRKRELVRLARNKDRERSTTVHIGEAMPDVLAELLVINAKAQRKAV